MDKVIVVGCFIPGYAVIRALGNKGLYLIALSYSDNDIGQVSRYVSEVVRVPHPEKDEAGFIKTLLDNGPRWEGALILETADHTAVCLSRHKAELSKYYRIVTADWPILEKFIEKEKTYEIAEACGVPYPKSFTPQSLEDLKEKMQEMLYPCILKPVRSFEFVSRYKRKNFEVKNADELIEKYTLCMNDGIPIIVQEIIVGPDANLYKLMGYINSQGILTNKFFNRKLRQNPPGFGVMRVGISTERNAEVELLTEKLLCSAGYTGYFSIEFKKDPRDQKMKLMENNCRMPRSGMLPIASGVNYPWIIYLDLVKNQQVDITEYKAGLYWIELYTDISNTLYNHKKEDLSLRDYIRPYLAREKVFADFDIHDVRPFLKYTVSKLRGIVNHKN